MIMDYKIYKNSFILATLRVIEPIISMAVIIAISRVMGPESIGAYVFLIAFTSMFGTVSQMGLHALLVREVARNKERASIYLSSSIFIGIGTSTIIIIVMNASKGYFNLNPEINHCLLLLSFSLLPGFAVNTFDSIFMAFERADLIFYGQLTSTIIRVGVSLIAIWAGGGIFHLALIILFSGILTLILCIFMFKSYISKITYRVDFRISLDLMRNSWTFLLITVVSMVSARIDVLMLTRLTDMTQVALYSAAHKLFEMTMILPQAYFRSTFPELSRLSHSDSYSFRNMSKDMLRYTAFYILLAIPVILVVAPLIVDLLYGGKFSSSSKILQVLIIGLIPWGGARIFANILVTSNLQRYDLISGVFATAVNVVLNLILIPAFGGLGAAVALSCSLSSFCVLEFWYVRKVVNNLEITKILMWPLVGGSFVVLFTFVAKMGWVFAFLEIAVVTLGISIYFRKNGNCKRTIQNQIIILKSVIKS